MVRRATPTGGVTQTVDEDCSLVCNSVVLPTNYYLEQIQPNQANGQPQRRDD